MCRVTKKENTKNFAKLAKAKIHKQTQKVAKNKRNIEPQKKVTPNRRKILKQMLNY